MASPSDQIAALIEKWGPILAQAFAVAVAKIRSRAVLATIVDRLRTDDIDGAIATLQIERPAFIELEQAIEQAFTAGGILTADTMPKLPNGSRIGLVFGVRDTAAEGVLRDHSASLVTNVVQEQKDNIREVLTQGMMRGQNPTQTAYDVVGRINRVTGQREGGIIGLTKPQAEYVATARDELLSGDPAQLRNYLTRKRRDKRFDRTVQKAIEAGKPVPRETANKMVNSYSNSLQKLRADQLGLNESFMAIESSKNEAYAQAVAGGKVDADAITKTWKHLTVEHPRIQHVEMNGKAVRYDQPFIMPDGTQMMYPHDPKAPAYHTLGCHCQSDYSINFFAGLR